MIQNILKDKYPTMMDVIKDATINWNIQDPNSIKTRLDNICRNSDEIKTILIKEFKEKVGEKFYSQSEQVVRNFKSTYPSIYDFIKTVTNNWAIKDATEIKKNIEINTPRYTFGMISNEAHQKYLDKLLRFRQKVGDDIYDKVGDLQTLMRSNGKNIGWEKLIDRINSKYSNNIEKYIERKTRKEENRAKETQRMKKLRKQYKKKTDSDTYEAFKKYAKNLKKLNKAITLETIIDKVKGKDKDYIIRKNRKVKEKIRNGDKYAFS